MSGFGVRLAYMHLWNFGVIHKKLALPIKKKGGEKRRWGDGEIGRRTETVISGQ